LKGKKQAVMSVMHEGIKRSIFFTTTHKFGICFPRIDYDTHTISSGAVKLATFVVLAPSVFLWEEWVQL